MECRPREHSINLCLQTVAIQKKVNPCMPLFVALAIAVIVASTASFLTAQDISQLKQEKPIVITGNIATSNSFSGSNGNTGYRTPFSNHLNANLNFKLYGFDIPFSFYYSNNNRGFTHPFVNYGLSPKYKNIQLHLGYRSIQLSPMIYQGQTFLGVGAEANLWLIRLAGFKGSLNQAKGFEKDAPRPAMFQREAIGAKLGIGNSSNFFDVIVFTAADDTLSIKDTSITNKLYPKENVAAGTRLQFMVGKRITISAELAGSAYNDNARSDEIKIKELEPLHPWFALRTESKVSYAGNIQASLNFGKVNASVQYKKVHPEYYSLGVPYFANNLEMAGISLNTSIAKNRVMLSGSLFGQRDNLLKTQLYSNQNLVFNGSSTILFSKRLNLAITYNGFEQKQKDGTEHLSDSVRINRINHTTTIAPAYTIQKENALHAISLNTTFTQNNNRNKYLDDQQDQNNFIVGAQYSLIHKPSKMNYNGSYNFSETKSSLYGFISNNLGIGVGRRFLKDDKLNIQLNNMIAFTKITGLSSNKSFTTTLSTGYTYKKKHTGSFRIQYSMLNNYSLNQGSTLNGYNFGTFLSYNYNFILVDMEKKTRERNTRLKKIRIKTDIS